MTTRKPVSARDRVLQKGAEDEIWRKKPDPHSHACDWCGRSYLCRLGEDCPLGPREGFCNEACENHLSPVFLP